MSLSPATLLTVGCFGFDDFSQTHEKLLSGARGGGVGILAQQEIICSHKKKKKKKKCFITDAPRTHTPQPHNTKPNEFTDIYAPEQYLSLLCQKKKKVITENQTKAGKQKGGEGGVVRVGACCESVCVCVSRLRGHLQSHHICRH